MVLRGTVLLFFFFISVHAKLQIYFTDTPLQSIGTRVYRQELLTKEFDEPRELVYDSASRNLFFTYMDDVIQNSGRALVNVFTKEAKKIEGIEKNKATAIDLETGEIYFGTENGLYKYDPLDIKATNIGLYNINILKLVIRNNEMYLIDANTHMLYKVFHDGRIVVREGDVKSLIEFDVDNERNIHYMSLCGLFCRTSEKEIVKNKDLSLVYHFLVDDNRTLGITEDAIYELDCKEGSAKKMAKITFFPRSIVLGDYGDIFYSDDNNHIYRLRPITSYLVYNIHRKQQT